MSTILQINGQPVLFASARVDHIDEEANVLIIDENGNVTIPGTLSVAEGIVALADSVAQLTITTAASKIIPGATSLSLRNHADTLNNILVFDNGGVRIPRSTVAIGFDPYTAESASPGGDASLYLLGLAVNPFTTQLNIYYETRPTASATAIVGFASGALQGPPGANVSDMFGFRVNSATAGAGGTVTTIRGVSIRAFSAGSANNIGIDIESITGAGPFAIRTGLGPVNFGDSVNIASGKVYKVNGTQVVSARVTGWAAATGTKSKATFITDSATTAAGLARLGQLIDDLIAHGIIGA